MSHRPPEKSQSRMRMRPSGGSIRGMTGESASNTRLAIRRLFAYLRPYRLKLLGVALLVVVSTAAALAGPILIGISIDQYIIPGDVAGLLRLVLVMLAVYVVGGITMILQGVAMVGIGQQLMADIRAELFSHIQTLSMGYHDRHRAGDLMSRVSNDTEAINTVLSNGLIQFTSNILLFGGILVAMFFLNWPLAVGMLIILPLMLFITSQFTRRTRLAFRNVQRHLGGMNAVMEENITGLRVVQAFAQEEDAISTFRRVNSAYKESGTRAEVITAALGPMFTTMSTITIAAAALLGGWLALQGLVTVGVIATFVVYIRNFFRPMRSIAMLYNQLQSALAGAERIFEVLDARPAVLDPPTALALPIRGEVVFDHVSFAYEPGKPVLEDVSLTASPGQTIALVGPTGAGKTTIISLLSRFYDVDEGCITIDGHDIRSLQQLAPWHNRVWPRRNCRQAPHSGWWPLAKPPPPAG